MSFILAARPLPDVTRPHVLIDLVALIEQGVGQVHGSDERGMLEEWLLRNTEPQIVTVELESVLAADAKCLRANTQEMSQ
jgi:hypothetical protein